MSKGDIIAREAVERCAIMDEGWANSYTIDADNIEAGKHPALQDRVATLRIRAATHLEKAKAYRLWLAEHGSEKQKPTTNLNE